MLERQSFYDVINKAEYMQYPVVDTILENNGYLITHNKTTQSRFVLLKLLVRKSGNKDTSYFMLSSDAEVESDSTIIANTQIFKSSTENTDKIPNGIWIYMSHYSEKDTSSVLQTSSSGFKFSVDSMPSNLRSDFRPTEEGIYFYKRDTLLMVSREQSEEALYRMKDNGFYFIPNKGILFKRYLIRDIH